VSTINYKLITVRLNSIQTELKVSLLSDFRQLINANCGEHC